MAVKFATAPGSRFSQFALDGREYHLRAPWLAEFRNASEKNRALIMGTVEAHGNDGNLHVVWRGKERGRERSEAVYVSAFAHMLRVFESGVFSERIERAEMELDEAKKYADAARVENESAHLACVETGKKIDQKWKTITRLMKLIQSANQKAREYRKDATVAMECLMRLKEDPLHAAARGIKPVKIMLDECDERRRAVAERCIALGNREGNAPDYGKITDWGVFYLELFDSIAKGNMRQLRRCLEVDSRLCADGANRPIVEEIPQYENPLAPAANGSKIQHFARLMAFRYEMRAETSEANPDLAAFVGMLDIGLLKKEAEVRSKQAGGEAGNFASLIGVDKETGKIAQEVRRLMSESAMHESKLHLEVAGLLELHEALLRQIKQRDEIWLELQEAINACLRAEGRLGKKREAAALRSSLAHRLEERVDEIMREEILRKYGDVEKSEEAKKRAARASEKERRRQEWQRMQTQPEPITPESGDEWKKYVTISDDAQEELRALKPSWLEEEYRKKIAKLPFGKHLFLHGLEFLTKAVAHAHMFHKGEIAYEVHGSAPPYRITVLHVFPPGEHNHKYRDFYKSLEK